MIRQEDKMGVKLMLPTHYLIIGEVSMHSLILFLNYFTLLEKRFMGDPIDGSP
jgi:hypothetical protein